MNAHTHTLYPEHVLARLRAIAPDLEQVCLQWGHAPGADDADDANALLDDVIGRLNTALTKRDGYSDTDRQRDLLSAAQDERRGL